MKYSLILFFSLLLFFPSYATHNRAGEITYERISGYTYRATIITYTKIADAADRNSLIIHWGDGDSTEIFRTNGPDQYNDLGNPGADGIPDGENLGNDTKKNIYGGVLDPRAVHTYPGASSYWIWMADPNRNQNILNIPNSVDIAFYLRSLLVVNSILGQNSSPMLLNPPIDMACINRCFYHNPSAYDVDGDSLSYELVYCLANGQPIPGYVFPNAIGGGSLSVDAYTGELAWCSPQQIGEYNVAMLIKEWRGGYLIGSVLRDMQIDVVSCNNTPPLIEELRDTCIEAGKFLQVKVTATDVDNSVISLSASGGPVSPFVLVPAANFSPVTGFVPVTSYFSWQTGCNHIRKQPYMVNFKVDDNADPFSLVDFETLLITVVGPAPTNTSATPSGSSIVLKWDKGLCNPGSNNAYTYKIYRHSGYTGWKHGYCETGVPGYTGYTLIGTTTDFNDTTFTDNNNGSGLIHGVDYCYMIVTCYVDGSESYATDEFCAQLVQDVPIITNVTVDSTSLTDGRISIKWLKPIADSANFDTVINPGPYEFRLLQAQGYTGSLVYNQIASFTSPYFESLTANSYASSALNTAQHPYTYKIEFYSDSLLKGSTHTASSVYLSVASSDNQLTLSWEEYVPWNNYKYYVYKKNSAGAFVLLDSTVLPKYTEYNLPNGQQVCYKIESFGKYTDTTIVFPLINFSEEMCATPEDLIPPCAPSFSVSANCTSGEDSLTWTNPNNHCADDVIFYRIYFSSLENGELKLLATINDLADTSYTYHNANSIAGCFSVVAVDSFMNQNIISRIVCVDNCPEYELPNVFSPNNDGSNELFIPLPFKYVQDIDIKIYDRWGLLVFQTTDPQINWNGENQFTKKPSQDGVYFYVCKVNEIRVTGLEPRILTGSIQLFNK